MVYENSMDFAIRLTQIYNCSFVVMRPWAICLPTVYRWLLSSEKQVISQLYSSWVC